MRAAVSIRWFTGEHQFGAFGVVPKDNPSYNPSLPPHPHCSKRGLATCRLVSWVGREFLVAAWIWVGRLQAHVHSNHTTLLVWCMPNCSLLTTHHIPYLQPESRRYVGVRLTSCTINNNVLRPAFQWLMPASIISSESRWLHRWQNVCMSPLKSSQHHVTLPSSDKNLMSKLEIGWLLAYYT